ncbi:MAG TPA: CBASS cGAMP synthase [Gammaproteobacteria bacterium]|nr:CBASS cGAMP synthase [Gammaproteobacteria bacterium]
MLNFHRCFISTDTQQDDTYLNNLDLRSSDREKLLKSRQLIRQVLREAYRRETASFMNGEKPISPNFFTQGSWSYKTLNRPTHNPPQQTDMDDGCYLPMTFVRGTNPKRAAGWFFEIADRELRALVAEMNWAGYDDSKPTCCRVIVDARNHVDVPLYAIRDDQFVLMKSAGRERAGRVLFAAADAEDEYVFDWQMVTDEDVLLARRNGIWTPSNPRSVSEWAESAVDQHGAQLRRVWRASKGWRDQTFPSGGPSSIALMVMVEADFDEVDRRDDLAMKAAARSIRQRITGKIFAPWDKREDLNRLTEAERAGVAQAARALEAELERCADGAPAEAAACLSRLGVHFGRHFSADVSRVAEASPREVVHSYSAAPAVIPSFRGDNRSA